MEASDLIQTGDTFVGKYKELTVLTVKDDKAWRVKMKCEYCGAVFEGFASKQMLKDHKRAEHSTQAA